MAGVDVVKVVVVRPRPLDCLRRSNGAEEGISSERATT
jgi:hypothetical protein